MRSLRIKIISPPKYNNSSTICNTESYAKWMRICEGSYPVYCPDNSFRLGEVALAYFAVVAAATLSENRGALGNAESRGV